MWRLIIKNVARIAFQLNKVKLNSVYEVELLNYVHLTVCMPYVCSVWLIVTTQNQMCKE